MEGFFWCVFLLVCLVFCFGFLCVYLFVLWGFFDLLIHIQPWLAFPAGWLLFMPIAVFNQFDSTKLNWSILGKLISKCKQCCGGVELQHTAVHQPWLNLPGFPALSWSFAPAQYSDFSELKRSHCSIWVAGGAGCLVAQASLIWHYYTSLSPCSRLVLGESSKIRRLKGILWLFTAIYSCYPWCYGCSLHVFG